jgi:hypothetical protein
MNGGSRSQLHHSSFFFNVNLMKSFAAVVHPSSPLNPPPVRDFEQEILAGSPPKLGGWGAKALNNEAEKLYQIHVSLVIHFSDNRLFGALD